MLTHIYFPWPIWCVIMKKKKVISILVLSSVLFEFYLFILFIYLFFQLYCIQRCKQEFVCSDSNTTQEKVCQMCIESDNRSIKMRK